MLEDGWIDLSSAVQILSVSVGSTSLGRSMFRSALIEGSIKSRAKYQSLIARTTPIPTPPGEHLPNDFWKSAKIDWDDFTKAIIHPLIFVNGTKPRTISYREVYLVQVLMEDTKLKWPDVFSSAITQSTKLENISATQSITKRKRGPQPTQLLRVRAEMRLLPIDMLSSMKQEAMAATFKASRSTCEKARDEVLSEIAANQNSDKR